MKIAVAVLLLGACYEAMASDCLARRREAQSSGRMGAYTPTCESDGRYHHTQCHGSVCFCVDRETGEKQPGTEGHIAKYGDVERRCQAVTKRGSESKCQEERRTALSSGLLGAFTPQCKSDGSYEPKQCHERYCFCVDTETGKTVEGTAREYDSSDDLEELCNSRTSKREALTDCQRKRKQALESGLIGAYVPQCEKDGRYHHTQCHGSVCFCAHPETGERREGSEGPISSISDVEKKCQTYTKRGSSTCTQQREEAIRSGLLGRFTPDCEADGSFSPVQCHEMMCFCVEPETGEQIPDTSRIAYGRTSSAYNDLKKECTVNTPLAKRTASKCQAQREKALSSGLMGAFAPVCEADGSYASMQCREAVCYCADSETGEAIDGTQGHVSGYDEIKKQCATHKREIHILADTPKKECKNTRRAFRWNKCPQGCSYYLGDGEALIICCCDKE